MANTQYVTTNRLSTEASQARKRILLIGTPVTLILLLLFPGFWWFLLAVFLIIFLNTGATKRAGAAGEDTTLSILSALPDSYTIFNQIPVPNEQSRTGYTELDFIVLGPNGVFVIEVKNHNGTITGSEEDREWIQHKIGRNGTPYTASMRNPIRQLKRQIWALNQFTKKRGYATWLEGIVFFSNTESRLELHGKFSTPVLQYTSLTEHILRHKPKYTPKNLDQMAHNLATMAPSSRS